MEVRDVHENGNRVAKADETCLHDKYSWAHTWREKEDEQRIT